MYEANPSWLIDRHGGACHERQAAYSGHQANQAASNVLK
jgi:hypothetical protein